MIYINARFLTQRRTGVQRFAFEISRELKRIRRDVVFITSPGTVNKDMAEELEPVIIGYSRSFLWEQVELPVFLFKKGRPLLVNLGNTAPVLYDRKIVTIHDLAVYRYPESFSRTFVRYYRWMLPRIAKKSLKVITVSNFSKGEIEEILGIEPEKIEVVRNAVSSDIKRVDVPRKNIILTVSSLDPRKNLINLVKAFKGIEGYRLFIAGASSGVFRGFELRETDRIRLLGHVSDKQLSMLYSTAEVFVYPSIYEGFGIPPLEAMKCGCPVVVSDIPPHREVCGDAALYVDPHSTESIKAGILKVLKDKVLRETLIKKGERRVAEFSWEKSALKLSSVIDSVLHA